MLLIPTLKTSGYLLRKIIQDDIHNIFKGLSDPLVVRYYGVSFTDLQSTQQQLDWYADLERTGNGLWWAIEHNLTGNFIGACGFNDIRREDSSAEIGFWLMPEYWGTGVLKECLPAILQYAVLHLKLKRIDALIEPENSNSITLAGKIGFQFQNRLIDCERKNGKLISLDIYSWSAD